MTGYGAWVPKTTEQTPRLTIDLKTLYTLSAVAVGGQVERPDWASVNMSYATERDVWIWHSDIASSLLLGRYEGGEGVTLQINPPIGQARFFKLDIMGSKISLKLELFGCLVPATRKFYCHYGCNV